MALNDEHLKERFGCELIEIGREHPVIGIPAGEVLPVEQLIDIYTSRIEKNKAEWQRKWRMTKMAFLVGVCSLTMTNIIGMALTPAIYYLQSVLGLLLTGFTGLQLYQNRHDAKRQKESFDVENAVELLLSSGSLVRRWKQKRSSTVMTD